AGTLVNVQSVTYFGSRRGRAGVVASMAVALVVAAALVAVSLLVNWLALGIPQNPTYHLANLYTLVIPIVIIGDVFAGVLLSEQRVGAFWLTQFANGFSAMLAIILL